MIYFDKNSLQNGFFESVHIEILALRMHFQYSSTSTYRLSFSYRKLTFEKIYRVQCNNLLTQTVCADLTLTVAYTINIISHNDNTQSFPDVSGFFQKAVSFGNR